ncbi:MAG: tetratricopeptide repeat protein [Planctomycetes bacterium]|nr:tetratricopeptide repeat protein [Planctomycetota bacterium]
MDEDLFRVQAWDEVILKDGTPLKGTIIETDDKDVIKVRLANGAARTLTKDEVKEIKRKTSPETILDQIVEKYNSDPASLAANIREVYKRYRGMEAKALAILEKLAAQGNKDILALLAERYLEAGNTTAAEVTAKKIVERSPTAEGYRLLGMALSTMGKDAEALDALNKAKQLAPENEDVLVALAQIQLASGKADEAKKVFDDTLSKNPNSPAANVGLGYVLLRQGKFAEAAQAFEKVGQTAPKPQLLKAKLGLAACKIMLKEYDAAYKLGDDALTLDNRSAQAYGLKGFAKLMSGDVTQLPAAVRFVEESLHENPADPRMLVIKAVTLDRGAQVDDLNAKPQEAKAKRDEAAKLLAQVEGMKLSDAWLKYLLAELRFEQKDYDNASAGFEEAARLAPAFAPAQQAKGALLLRSRKWTEAAAAYRKAIELDGTHSEYYSGLGLALLGTTNLEEAQKQFKKALDLEPKNVSALCGLGYIANYEKDEARAREMFQAALASDGTCAYAADALTKIFAERDLQLDYFTFENNADPRDWSAKGGRQVKATPANGALLYYGNQGMAASGKIEYLTPLNAPDFVRLEADLQISPDSPAILALRIASRANSATNFELEFGKDNAKHIAYRFRDYGGQPPDWRALPDPWPESGKVRLAIETQEVRSGSFFLFINGSNKGELKLKLTNPTKISAGFVCEVPEKESVDAKIDNVALLKRRIPEVEGPKTGELVPVEPKKEPAKTDAPKSDAPKEDKK